LLNSTFHIILLLSVLAACSTPNTKEPESVNALNDSLNKIESATTAEDEIISISEYFTVTEEVYVKDYHKWIKAVIDSINKDRPYQLDEYILVHANPWIIDSLRNTDYYYLKDQGIISKDPTAIKLLDKDQKLLIPDSVTTLKIKNDLDNTRLDLNIPEFRLRIIRYDSIIAEFPVRVGRNDRRYLEMAKSTINLRTMPGNGKIVRINRNPSFINPRDNKRYKVTRRDDNIVTALPNIPWLEPEINGIRYGQLIHPTTNLETLGKPVSNGCIGLRESDAWSIYFYAPLGTVVNIRYDLEVQDTEGNTIKLENIYPGFEKLQNRINEAKAAATAAAKLKEPLCHCGKTD